MSDTRKIPGAEWEAYKDEIQFLYLTEDNSREEVMAAMEKTHGFRASKSQYIRKLDQWGFKKYFTDEEWKFIARKSQKRTLEGKDSDVYCGNRLMSRKKVKREISRHSPPSWQVMEIAGRSPAPTRGIDIRTPPQERNSFVQYLHIPWFEFETLVEPQMNRLLALAWGLRKMPSVCERPDQESYHPLMWATQNLTPLLQVREWTEDPNLPLLHEQKGLSLFANILGKPINPNSHDFLSTLTSHLNNSLIERQDGDIARNLQKFFGSSSLTVTLQLLRYSVYLSSNNLLSEKQTDMLLEWVIQGDQFAAIEPLIKLKIATTKIFASDILLSAVRLGHNSTIRALITLGIDVNVPGGCYPKELALMTAITQLIQKSHRTSRQENLSVITLLLEAGADIKAKSRRTSTSPLQKAISEKHVRLTQLFLNSETMDDLENELGSIDTELRKAARNNDFSLMRRLLEIKARLDKLTEPSMMTLLQDAVSRHCIDTVQDLLDVGADLDAPAGIAYESARKSVTPNNLRHLQSAIQIATDRGMAETVITLLEGGANVDGYFLTEEEYSIYDSIHHRLFESRTTTFYELDVDDLDSEDDDIGISSKHCNEDCIYRPHFYRTPLQSAVEQGKSALVWILLAAGADVEGRGRGLTPLQIAAMKNEIWLVKLLLKHGAAVNAPARGFYGRTALQAAIESGNTDIVEILISAGSDVNAAAGPKSGCTALQAAASKNNIGLVRKLISLGADVNAAASPLYGQTCLQAAAGGGSSDLVQLLLNSGAEVNATDNNGCTALQAAAGGRHVSVVETLLAAGADVHSPITDRKRGFSAISAAVMGNNLEILELLLKIPDPNSQDDPVPPLLIASLRGQTEIVKCLIKEGANVDTLRNDQSSFGYGYPCTALEAALVNGDNYIIHMVLDASARCNGQVPGLRAALGAASIKWRYGFNHIHMDICQNLLSAGADVNRAFSDWGMPLHNAAYIGRVNLVQILLDAGADVNSRSPDGNTALINAVQSEDIDTIRLLLKAGADMEAFAPTIGGRTALQHAAYFGDTTVVRFLLEQGADCNARAADSEGITALQAAAIIGHLPIALMLLEAGANIDAPAAKISGRSALEAAAEHGRLDIVALLLENHIGTDGLGNICECAAKLAENNGHIPIVRMLRSHKID